MPILGHTLFCFMDGSIRAFLDHIRHQRNYSEHTCAAYGKDLDQFRNYMVVQYEVESPAAVENAMLRSWVVALLEAGNGASGIGRKVSAIKSYYKYLRRTGQVTSNPTLRLQVPKIRKKLPVFVPEAEMESLWFLPIDETDYRQVLDRTIMMLLYGSGIRVAELCGLKADGFHLAEQRIKVLGKRNKERMVPLSGQVVSMIEKCRSLQRQMPYFPTIYLLVSEKGKKLYPRFVYRVVNSYLRKVATLTKKSPHVLRHTFATHMLNNGADLNTIKELLGHSSLAATQVYTHNSIEKLKGVYNQAHPRGDH